MQNRSLLVLAGFVQRRASLLYEQGGKALHGAERGPEVVSDGLDEGFELAVGGEGGLGGGISARVNGAALRISHEANGRHY